MWVGSTISAMPRTAKDRDSVSPLCVDESLGNSSAATPRVDNGEEEEADLVSSNHRQCTAVSLLLG